MRCCDCIFHAKSYLWNACSLTGSEYYYEYSDKPCPVIDDDYIIKIDCPEYGLKRGVKAGKQE